MIDKDKLEMIKYRRHKSYETLDEVSKILDLELIPLAMNRVYYAGFYIISALSLIDNFSTSKHMQLIGYFNKNYVSTGKIKLEIGNILGITFSKRNSVDYHDFTLITKSEVIQYFELMKKFVAEVDSLIEEKLKT